MAPALGLAYGYYTLEQLRGRTAVELFDAFGRHAGVRADPCVEDSYRGEVYFYKAFTVSR